MQARSGAKTSSAHGEVSRYVRKVMRETMVSVHASHRCRMQAWSSVKTSSAHGEVSR
jgi:hypothetical protein